MHSLAASSSANATVTRTPHASLFNRRRYVYFKAATSGLFGVNFAILFIGKKIPLWVSIASSGKRVRRKHVRRSRNCEILY